MLLPSLSKASADLTAQKHFVQLGCCLVREEVTLSDATSQSELMGKRKGKFPSLLPFSSPEFIPENCTPCPFIFKWN